MNARYPRTITNGGGEELTFLGIVRDADGARLEVEACAEPGAGPPMHVHYLQEEAMCVQSGRLGYQILGEPERFAGPGETIVFAPGVAHRWWNAGQTQLRSTGWAKPPDNMEFFLSALFDTIKEHGGKRPGVFDIAYLVTRYRSEISTYAVPLPVQRILFPIVLTIGHALGKYRKFKDAPPSVRRAAEARSAPV